MLPVGLIHPSAWKGNSKKFAFTRLCEVRAGVKMSLRQDSPRIAEIRVLRGGLALDALYLLARDVDRAGELVGLEHPAFHHILDLPRSEVEILGRLRQGDFFAFFVFHPTNLLAGKDGGRDTPQGYTGPFSSPYSPKCVEQEFSEVRV